MDTLTWEMANSVIEKLYGLLNGNVDNETYIQENMVDFDPRLINSDEFRRVFFHGNWILLSAAQIHECYRRKIDCTLSRRQMTSPDDIQNTMFTMTIRLRVGSSKEIGFQVASGNIWGDGTFNHWTRGIQIEITENDRRFQFFNEIFTPRFVAGLGKDDQVEIFTSNIAKHLANRIALEFIKGSDRIRAERAGGPGVPPPRVPFEEVGPRSSDASSRPGGPHLDTCASHLKWQVLGRLINIVHQLNDIKTKSIEL